MKTEIELKSDEPQTDLKAGMRGYIDGYVRGGDDVPYAVVIVGETVEMVKLYNLKVLHPKSPFSL